MLIEKYYIDERHIMLIEKYYIDERQKVLIRKHIRLTGEAYNGEEQGM